MKLSTHDKATGTIHEAKGAIRQKVGEITNNPDLAADGETEKNMGKVQNFVEKMKRPLGNK